MTTLNGTISETPELSGTEIDFSAYRRLETDTDIGQLSALVMDLRMQMIASAKHWDVAVLNELFDRADGIFEAYISVVADRIAHLESTTEDLLSRQSEQELAG